MAVRASVKLESRGAPEESQVVASRAVGESRIVYALIIAVPGLPLAEVVRAQRRRNRIEKMFAVGNGKAGFDHYEVRNRVGWHHSEEPRICQWPKAAEELPLRRPKPNTSQAAEASALQLAEASARIVMAREVVVAFSDALEVSLDC
jgi:hypothetical protein